MLAILILAAGQSTRMRGADKLVESVDGAPLIRTQVERALATGHDVYVALPDADHPRVRHLAGLDVAKVYVPNAVDGLSVSLRAGLAAVPKNCAVVIMLADLVDVTVSDLHTVITAHQAHPNFDVWRGATSEGKPGHPIVISAALRSAFAGLTGDNGGAAILKSPNTRVMLVPFADDRALRDLDTPEDWADWRKSQATT